MAHAEKLRSLHEELSAQEKKLEELKQRYGSPPGPTHPESAQHALSVQEVIASTKRTIQSLIEVLGEAGL